MSHKQQPQKQLRQESKSATCKKNMQKCSEGSSGSSAAVNTTLASQNISKERLQVNKKSIISNTNRKAAGSNWEVTQKNQQAEQKQPPPKGENNISGMGNGKTKSARLREKRRAAEEKYVAMDCEMVGVGPNGQGDMLARVSIVTKRGKVLLDKFVKPQEPVTNYRTNISGIRPLNINNAANFNIVQDEVVQILQDKILVGHGIRKDLSVLHIQHPASNIRDTAQYEPFRRVISNGGTPSLKRLTKEILGKEIQIGEHNSVEDARAVMGIYNVFSKDWETYIKRREQWRRK